MRILFLDQSGNLGGAELCLLDLAKLYRNSCLVSLFVDGLFRKALEQQQIPVHILSTKPIPINRDSSSWQIVSNISQLIPLIREVAKLSHAYDLIYANTQKAMVVGTIVSLLTRKPLVYHLHDILCPQHFSRANRQLAILLANNFTDLVIANSQATRSAFIAAGGNSKRIQVVYNGFNFKQYQYQPQKASQLRQQLNLEGHFVVGHFSRLSPWKGQHVLIEALIYCPNTVAIFVGDALFGEHEYVEELHQQVEQLGLKERVRFLGFRSDIPQLMSMCDLIAHTSTAPEPFGRVIVEGMLCGKPVIAAAAGGVLELIANGQTGWLTTPGDVQQLVEIIKQCQKQPELTKAIADAGKIAATRHFNLADIQQQINHLLCQAFDFPTEP